nr:hypothetical protein [Sicyoidochytrium minutum DNA virus]
MAVTRQQLLARPNVPTRKDQRSPFAFLFPQTVYANDPPLALDKIFNPDPELLKEDGTPVDGPADAVVQAAIQSAKNPPKGLIDDPFISLTPISFILVIIVVALIFIIVFVGVQAAAR